MAHTRRERLFQKRRLYHKRYAEQQRRMTVLSPQSEEGKELLHQQTVRRVTTPKLSGGNAYCKPRRFYGNSHDPADRRGCQSLLALREGLDEL